MGQGRLEAGLHLHFDCASGAAGDMTLAALFDAGVPVEVVREALERIGVGGERLTVARVVKGGIAGIDVKVDAGKPGPDHHAHGHGHDHDHHGHHHAHEHHHAHDHSHHHHQEGSEPHAHEHGHGGHDHRRWTDIRALIVGAGLGEGVVRRALDMFERVARAEAKLHGTTVEEVAFHEVGAIDSIVDIVGTAAALDWLAPASVSCVRVAMGHGTVRSAHGMLPVPSPAALEILREAGGVMTDGGVPRELCTPTGAAILAASVTRWGPAPEGVAVAIGYGAGDMELADRPNVLRVTVSRPAASSDPSLLRIEANVDDMSPELCEHAADELFAAGAVDVWWTPVTMKKSRPALVLAALAPEAAREAVCRAILRETSSIGVRFDRVERRVLERRSVTVATPYGELPVKVAYLDGEEVNAAPEYGACREAARRAGAPLKRVFAAAVAAYERARSG